MIGRALRLVITVNNVNIYTPKYFAIMLTNCIFTNIVNAKSPRMVDHA